MIFLSFFPLSQNQLKKTLKRSPKLLFSFSFLLLLVPHPALLEPDRRPLLGELLDLEGQLGDSCGGSRVDILAELFELGPCLARLLDVGGDLAAAVHKLRDLVEVGLDEATGSQGGGAHAESPRNQGGDVAGDGVLVGGDVRELLLRLFLFFF